MLINAYIDGRQSHRLLRRGKVSIISKLYLWEKITGCQKKLSSEELSTIPRHRVIAAIQA